MLSRIAPGRGGWLCLRQTCAETALKRGLFAKALKMALSKDALTRLMNEVAQLEYRAATQLGEETLPMWNDGMPAESR